MFADTFSRRVLFNFVLIFIFLAIYILLFYNIYTSDTIIISFAVHPFNICEKYPETWLKLKLLYILISTLSSLICINLIYNSIFSKKISNKPYNTKVSPNSLSIFVANDSFGNPIILPEASLYQNILITRYYWIW